MATIETPIHENTLFKGFVSPLGVAHFLGIRYATIPARFREAQLVDSQALSGSIDATQYGPVCPQPPDPIRHTRQHLFEGAPQVSYTYDNLDCLRLNVYAPADAVVSRQRLPVLVWIHGGGLAIENGNADFTGDYLVSHTSNIGKPLVFVSINYRLGYFGFLSSAELAADAESHGETWWANQGLHDQRVALQWIRNNVSHFGGNPDEMTIAGESVGGFSVLAHLQSNEPVCKRGIIQSGPSWNLERPQAAQAKLDTLISRIGVPANVPGAEKVAALRVLPAEKIVYLLNGQIIAAPNWDPNWFGDESLLTGSIDCAGKLSEWAESVVVGSMRDEVTIFPLDQIFKTTTEVMDSVRAALRPGKDDVDEHYADEILEAYGLKDNLVHSDAMERLRALATDACFHRVGYNISKKNPELPVYVYRFDQPDVQDGSIHRGDAYHLLDLAYLCRLPAVAGKEAPLSCRATVDAFSDMLTKYVYGYSPWETYSDGKEIMIFDGQQTRVEKQEIAPLRWRVLGTPERGRRFGQFFFNLMRGGWLL
ncbi:hypothetical protein SI65_09126 [Aspergillus cristatus]|uniref:Carboxylesterase type B domain-containing protein n=1 Tax=Aspergillus cristatus TaxID=573508 RepID=A0A1E3B3J8_ASPCR|nr:hypothetical protein SI65_09126 [Aspergillus cristatus]